MYAWARGCGFLGAALFAGTTVLSAQVINESDAPRRTITNDTVLVVGAATDAAPYSYFEHDVARGFAADLLDAVAKESQLRIRRVPLPLHELQPALESGEIDIVQLWAETPARAEIADFTVPALLLKLVVVVRKDDARFKTLDDLADKTIATGSIGSVASTYIAGKFPTSVNVHTSNPAEVLQSVADGRCDAAVLARLSAHWGIEKAQHENLRVLNATIEGYDVRHGLAVRRGDAVLLGRLNEGLALVRANGEFDRIYFRWFGRYEANRFSALEVTSYVAATLALGMILTVWGFARQRRLARHIASQASELLGQQSLHAALFDNHPLATLVLEAAPDAGAPRILSLNREAGLLCGIDPASAAGRPVDTLSITRDVRGYFTEIITRWPPRGETAVLETRLRESRSLLETTLVALAPGSSGSARLCVLSSDVTRRRLADREIAQNRRLRALGELVGGIAHEFNNLLTPVLAQATMLAHERRHDKELVSELSLIEDAARRSAALTRRLLAFGRRAEESVGTVDVKAALDSCVALLRPTFDRRITWEIDLPDGLSPAAFDPTDLHQIAFNLIINARDTLVDRLSDTKNAATWSPRLRISLRHLPADAHLPRQPRSGAELLGWQQVTIEDNGKGISAEHLDRIYEPFFTTKDVGRGTGIGLSTVWHLINEAGGVIDVESTVDVGTRFLACFPVWSQPAETTGSTASLTQSDAVIPKTPPAPHAKRSILVVEDEAIVAHALLSTVRRLGHTVCHATDGQSAWDEMQARAGDFDVILVDINMPRMSGVDFVRHVRTLSWSGEIIVMSGRVAESDMRELERLSVDRVLIKPFTPNDLAQVLLPGSGG